MTAHYGIVVTLIAAKNRERALVVARQRGLYSGQWRMLTFETHQAFPEASVYLDRTWADHRNPAMIESIFARRVLMATDQRLGPGSRAVIARDGV